MATNQKHVAAKSSKDIPSTLKGRRAFLEKELKKYQGKTFHCKAIGVNVIVTEKSISEIAFNAALSTKATEIALYLPFAVRNAEIVKLHLPTESHKQTRDFHFIDIGIFRCKIPKVGEAKVVIGFRRNGKAIEYSITDYQAR